MKRMPFERPTDHYDSKIFSIDEEICSLLKKRKDISNHNPGFPPLETISKWANEYNLYEDLLRSIFSTLMNEEHFRPVIEPKGFKKNVPILKSVEKEDVLFTVTFIRQYSNASVVNLAIDWEPNDQENRVHHRFFELELGDDYDCRASGGGGSEGHMSFKYTVSPPLPDQPSGLDLFFKEREAGLYNKHTGLEFKINLG